jgi:hypothetical protein
MDATSTTPDLVDPKPSNTLEPDLSPDTHQGVPKDWKFWCIIFSFGLSILLTAVEFVSHLLITSLGQRVVAEAKPGYRLGSGQRYLRLSMS